MPTFIGIDCHKAYSVYSVLFAASPVHSRLALDVGVRLRAAFLRMYT
jgi:hypothetical protein